MNDARKQEVTQILSALGAGDPKAAAELLPLVYEELRKLAGARMAKESENQTLQPTALVHEAYIRLIGSEGQDAAKGWDHRGHFFAAAAQAMRRILVERARHRDRIKHGGGRRRVALSEDAVATESAGDGVDLVALDDAIQKLQDYDSRKAEVVVLRYFGGLSIEETAAALGVSPATVKNEWTFARAWLKRELGRGAGEGGDGDESGEGEAGEAG
jgi:RNA polymerase sigma factor (TIGR02999 family)